MTLALDFPEVFGFPAEMEALYSRVGPKGDERRLFRENRTVADIFALSTVPFEKFVDGNEAFDPELDVGGGCGGSGSCDVHTDDEENPAYLAA